MTANPEGIAQSRWSTATGLIGDVAAARWRFDYGLARSLSWSVLFARVDTASLAAVRIAMGLLVAIDALRKGQSFFYPSGGVLPFRFRYQFFHWVQEAPELSVYLPYVLAISGIALAIGFLFRFSSVLCLLLVTYGFLLQPENYLNHYYMLIIALFLLSISPAHKSFSIDRFLFFSRSDTSAPRIYLLLFKIQIEIILIYAGLVKINADWLQLEPLRTWLLRREDMAFLGSLWQSDFIVAIGAYGIIILHIVGAPLLFFRQTRLAVFLIYCVFHIANHFVFNIGIFPWMTIACTTIFFSADWPRRALGKLWPGLASTPLNPQPIRVEPQSFGNRILLAFCACWLLFQALFPLRHVLYPGWVEWTNEGHRFSWRMKLTDRSSTGVLLAAYIPEQKTVHIPMLTKYMSPRQYTRISMYPDLVQQLAWQIARKYKDKLQVGEVQVFAYVPMTMNNRRAALVIDPTVDLAATRSSIWHDLWLMKTNPNPLRRMEQVPTEERKTTPTLQDLLSSTGLPEPKYCLADVKSTADLHDTAVCHLDESTDWNFEW